MFLPPMNLTARLLIGAAFALCFLLLGMSIHKVYSDRKIKSMQLEWSQQMLAAEQALSKAIQAARDKETAWRDLLAAKEQENAKQIAARDARIRALTAAGNSLRDKLAAFVNTGGSAEDSSPAARDFRNRIETLGVLVGEADQLAEDSSREADALRDELALCRDYAKIVSDKQE